MNEEDKQKQILIKSGVDHFKQIREKSYDFRDDFAKENTIKYAELLIGLNVGLIGAMSFILTSSQNELTFISSVLSSFLVFSFISIVYSLGFRNSVIEANIKHQNEIGNKSQEAIEKISEIMEKHLKNYNSLVNELEKLTSDMNKKYDFLAKELLKKELKVNELRNKSEFFFSLSVSAICLIIIIESGFFEIICKLLYELLHLPL